MGLKENVTQTEENFLDMFHTLLKKYEFNF